MVNFEPAIFAKTESDQTALTKRADQISLRPGAADVGKYGFRSYNHGTCLTLNTTARFH